MYAGYIGFSVQIGGTKVKQMVQQSYPASIAVTIKAGFKREIECEGKKSRKELRVCEAQMVISCQQNGKYRVTFFEAKHN
jgi:hypothetical protein